MLCVPFRSPNRYSLSLLNATVFELLMWFEYFHRADRRSDRVRGRGVRQLNQNPDFAKAKLAFYSVPARGKPRGSIEYPREIANHEYVNRLIERATPAAADIETRLEGTKNAVFARCALGVRR
jgi:hypothetical protein